MPNTTTTTTEIIVPDTPEKIMIMLGIIFGIALFFGIGYMLYQMINEM